MKRQTCVVSANALLTYKQNPRQRDFPLGFHRDPRALSGMKVRIPHEHRHCLEGGRANEGASWYRGDATVLIEMGGDVYSALWGLMDHGTCRQQGCIHIHSNVLCTRRPAAAPEACASMHFSPETTAQGTINDNCHQRSPTDTR